MLKSCSAFFLVPKRCAGTRVDRSIVQPSSPQLFVDEMMAEFRRRVGPETPLQDDVTVVVIDVGAGITAATMTERATETSVLPHVRR